MKKISVAIATYNEENNIKKCLESVKVWVDEIIVVDGSSTDNTREIAKSYGARVIKTTNKPIFHINKQMAIDRAKGEWVLQLDADEVVSKELKKEIIDIVEKGSNFSAFYLPRKNIFMGKWLQKTAQYPDPVIRLFKRGKAHLPCKSVHEQMEVEGKIGMTKGHLFHYPYPSFSQYLQKSNRYTSLSAEEMLEKGIKPSFWELLKSIHLAKKHFFLLYLRHRGFQDGFPGFIFSFYSGLHFFTSYVKFWELKKSKRNLEIQKDWE